MSNLSDLPINNVLGEIITTLSKNNRVVLQAPPGAGKTTAVPVSLLNQAWLKSRQIIILEPRRIAARNAASRMAFILDEKVGETVGYQIRQEHCFSDKTKILVVTEGILTRKLQADPELKNTALIIFDEFHERSLHADLSLALCIQSQQVLRDDLKILVMSATLNTQAISRLLENAPVIQSEGKSYPVDINYIDSVKVNSASRLNKSQQFNILLLNTIKKVINEQQGSCLVFLPGVKEISQLTVKLKVYIKDENFTNIIIAPLHGSLNKQQQDQAISKSPENIRKIVLATNIAETSLTIEGINCVVDSGLERLLEYSPSTAMNGLITRAISQDSATQRSGRAGRLSAGVCYRLWTSQQQQRLAKHSVAEILHSDLTSPVLELANWGVQDFNELQWMDTPPSRSVNQAKSLLQKLNAIDGRGQITRHGKAMLNLGCHPRLAHMMLVAYELGQAFHACLIASILTEKDLFSSRSEASLDIYDRLNILNDLSAVSRNQKDIDLPQCKRIIKTADEFYQRIKRSVKTKANATANKNKSIDKELSGVLLAYAYPDRIARQRKLNQPEYVLSNGKGACIPEYLQDNLYEYVVVANLNANASKGDAVIYLFAETSLMLLKEYLPDLIRKKEIMNWNEINQRVESKVIEQLGEIVISEKLSTSIDRDEVLRVLISGIQKTGLQSFNWTQQANDLVNRVSFINHHRKLEKYCDFVNIELPVFSETTLLDSLGVWLRPFLTNQNSIKQCQKLDLYSMLNSQLDWEQKQLIDKLAPLKISVPSGSAISIDYTDVTQPVLAVRLQEVFGLYETPVIFNGCHQLMMHLLSPARRPMQITQDLNSFWKTTYHDVKKELRGKYKRHYWPDDPFTAQATSKTRKNMELK